MTLVYERNRFRAVETGMKRCRIMPTVLMLFLAAAMYAPAQQAPAGAAAFDAAFKEGRLVEAAKILDESLKASGYRDPGLLLRAARWAHTHGEDDRALSLYKLLSDAAPARSDAARESLEYLLTYGNDPEWFIRFSDQFGKAMPELSWQYGSRLMQRLMRDARAGDTLTVLERLLRDHGDDAPRIRWLGKMIYDGVGDGTFAGADIFTRVVNASVAVPTMPEYTLQRLIDNISGASAAETRARIILQIHQHRPVVSSWNILRNMEQANAVGDLNAREKIGREWLKAGAGYEASGDTTAWLNYLQTLAAMPKVFLETRLLDAAGLNSRITALKSAYGPADDAFRALLYNVQRNYIGNDQETKIAFYKHWGAELPDNLLGDYLNIGWGDDQLKAGLNAIIQAMPRERRYVISQALATYGQRIGSKGLVRQSLLDTMLWDPAGFNAGWVWGTMNGFKTFTPAEKIAIVKPWVDRVGTSSSWKALLELMRKDEAFSQTAEFKAFEAALPGIQGTDALAKSLVVLRDTPVKPAQYDQRQMQVFKAGLDALPGDLSAALRTSHPLEYQWARALNSACYRHVEKNRQGNIERMQIWASRLKETDDTWYWLIRGLVEDKRQQEARDLLPAYAAAIKADGTAGRIDWNYIRDLRPEPPADVMPFEDLYVIIGQQAAWTILSHYRYKDWWSPSFYIRQVVKVFEAAGDEEDITAGDAILNNYFNVTSDKAPFPPAFLDKLWRRCLSDGARAGEVRPYAEAYALSCYFRSGLPNEGRAAIDAYFKAVAARPAHEQLLAVSRLIEINALPTDFAVQLVRDRLLPLAANIQPRDAGLVYLDRLIPSLADLWRRDGKMSADEHGAVMAALYRLIDHGAGYFTGQTQYNSVFRSEIDRAAAANDWPAFSRAVGYLMDLNRNNGWAGVRQYQVEPILKILEAKDVPEVVYDFCTQVTESMAVDQEQVRKDMGIYRTSAARNIEGLIGVPKSDPTYDLHAAAQLLAAGNAAQAWQLTEPKVPLLIRDWETFSPDFVVWAIDRMRARRQLQEALDFSFAVLERESRLPDDIVASVYLVKGDIYRDLENYQAARAEYLSLSANPRFKELPAGQAAVLRQIDLMIKTRDYAAAESASLALIDRGTLVDQAEGYYFLARIAFEKGSYAEARDQLKETFRRNFSHVQGRLLEGELRLLLPRGLTSTEVLIGNPELQTVAIPGRDLTLKLQDPNLSIARGGKSIPVIVTTVKGGDREELDLIPGADDPTLFSASIATALGDARPGNFRLELTGDDEVSYIIESGFQKANDLDYAPKRLSIRSDAELTASAGRILTREEQEREELERRLNAGQTSRRFEGRTGRTVRPGSPVYVQVTDADRDVSSGRDRVSVRAETSSGDIVDGIVLEETEVHSGVFSGVIETGNPFPLAEVSDREEGNDPNGVINRNKSTGWRSLFDSQPPKWIEADTMSSHEVLKAELTMPNPGAVRQCRILGQLGSDTYLLGVYPEEAYLPRGGLVAEVRAESRGTAPHQLRRWVQTAPEQRLQLDQPVYNRSMLEDGRDNRRQTTRISGLFWTEEGGEHVFTWLEGGTRWRYLLIDGEVVLHNNTPRKRVYLPRGVHQMEILGYEQLQRNEQFSVGIITPEGEKVPVPAEWFSLENHPRLVEALKSKGQVIRTDSGFTVELNEPLRLKSVRWVFEDFAESGIVVDAIRLFDSEGRVVLPADQDFASGLNNNRLELAPGDDIFITYRDEYRLDEDSPVRTANLDSSFFDGEISIAFEHLAMDANGNEFTEYAPARRVAPGDQLMVIIRDFDLDLTDRADTVRVAVETSGGESLSLEARETALRRDRYNSDEHAGVFIETIRFGNQTTGNTIRVQADDVVTVRYLDEENNDPGIPVERSYAVVSPVPRTPALRILDARIEQIEDRSPAALETLRKLERAGQRGEDITLYRDVMTAFYADAHEQETQKVNSRAPLFIELTYPDAAKHEDSRTLVRVTAESEMKRADAEGREPARVDVAMTVGSLPGKARTLGYPLYKTDVPAGNADYLGDGLFAGLVRLQIGSPGDPLDDLVHSDERLFSGEEAMTSEAFRVPTLIVSGSDTLHIDVLNAGGDVMLSRSVRLYSDADLDLMDAAYEVSRSAIHLGQKFHVRVVDYDRDTSEERDVLPVSVTASNGDAVTLELVETLEHSGVFSGVLEPEFIAHDASGGALPPVTTNDVLEVDFGEQLTFAVTDDKPLSQDEPMVHERTASIYRGEDGALAGFTKRFKDPEMAVKTRFLTAEALFEMAKEHRRLGDEETADGEIAEGKRILEEAMRDYPDTSLVAQGEYLLANLAQELGSYQEAIGRYSKVISGWPDSEYASKSQLKKAICFEEMEQYDQATEEYVRLIYLYTDSPLVSDATVRLGRYYYDNEQFVTAAEIFRKFQENNPEHELAVRALFLAGQSLMKSEAFREAADVYERLVDRYPDEKELRSEAMYWMADARYRQGDYIGAYRNLKQLTWDYPESKWAKIARGRLTEEAFSRIEE